MCRRVHAGQPEHQDRHPAAGERLLEHDHDRIRVGHRTDVFTDHLQFYPEFAETEQIIPLDDYIERDGVDTSIYVAGLADLWQRPDGGQYGLPKDWTPWRSS